MLFPITPDSVAVVIVNFNAGALVLESLEALAQERSVACRLHVVIVDNDSQDDSVIQLTARIEARGWNSWVHLLDHRDNVGFAAGNNLGVAHVMSWTGVEPTHLLLLNPDARLLPGALSELLAASRQLGHQALLGAQIVESDGRTRPSAFRFPGLWSEFQRGLALGLLHRLVPASRIVDERVAGRTCRVDWVTGAAMLIPVALWKRLGPMDSRYFLYFEEVAYQRRAADLGIPVWTVPSARVHHQAGTSTGIVAGQSRGRPMPDYWYESWQRYFFDAYGPWRARWIGLAWLVGRLLNTLRRCESPWRAAARDGHSLRRFLELAVLRRARLPHRTVPGMAPPLPDGSSNENPPGLGLLDLWREDLRTHDHDLGSQGFWALAVHRFGNWRMGVRSPLMRAPLTVTYGVARKLVQVLCGIKLDYTVRVGRRVKLEHFGGMILGARSIGDDVVIRQNTTIGVRSVRDPNAKPVIGSRVDIGAGAVIVGHIRIGDDVSIGANCVVSFDVPSGSRVRSPEAQVMTPSGMPMLGLTRREVAFGRPTDFSSTL